MSSNCASERCIAGQAHLLSQMLTGLGSWHPKPCMHAEYDEATTAAVLPVIMQVIMRGAPERGAYGCTHVRSLR